jgi:hypothetical protein
VELPVVNASSLPNLKIERRSLESESMAI